MYHYYLASSARSSIGYKFKLLIFEILLKNQYSSFSIKVSNTISENLNKWKKISSERSLFHLILEEN
jgi:hypothetical protein